MLTLIGIACMAAGLCCVVPSVYRSFLCLTAESKTDSCIVIIVIFLLAAGSILLLADLELFRPLS